MRAIFRYLSEPRGASSAEFALVLLPFIALILGIIGVSLMIYANETLKFAAEDAARCASVKTTICTDAATTQTYALDHYAGPLVSPSFTYDGTAACGHLVTATASFPLNAVLVNVSVPLSASACFP